MRLRQAREFIHCDPSVDWGPKEQRFQALLAGAVDVEQFLDRDLDIKFDGVEVTKFGEEVTVTYNIVEKRIVSIIVHGGDLGNRLIQEYVDGRIG